MSLADELLADLEENEREAIEEELAEIKEEPLDDDELEAKEIIEEPMEIDLSVGQEGSLPQGFQLTRHHSRSPPSTKCASCMDPTA